MSTSCFPKYCSMLSGTQVIAMGVLGGLSVAVISGVSVWWGVFWKYGGVVVALAEGLCQ